MSKEQARPKAKAREKARARARAKASARARKYVPPGLKSQTSKHKGNLLKKY